LYEAAADSKPSQIEAARSAALGKSALANACNHALRLWGRLTRLLDYLELELADYCVENWMLSVVRGRNYRNLEMI